MKSTLTSRAEKTFKKLPPSIRKKFVKQLSFLERDTLHPSLRTKKMGGTKHFEARIDRHYRFTFIIENETVHILTLGPHDEGLGKK